ncbi:OmpA family protein [Marinobacter salicampi]|uniref:OmpA family protein n=1 Tax=Marinobacter salicampi TaxID=435907 RepID=UPI001F5F00F2|nr:OmpA family protein [Marinobacter salicampi]
MSHPYPALPGPLSSIGNKGPVQSLRSMRVLVCGGLMASLLAGCAATGDNAEVSSNGRASAPDVIKADTIDQSPIVVTDNSDNSPAKQKSSPINETKEEHMTVLVLDNPELMARAATLDTGFARPIPTLEHSPRKPHRMRFHYNFNSHRLTEEDEQTLRQHAAYLKAHPELRVHVHGHTDTFGNDEYNTFLARLRASSAAKLLVSEGIAESRIQTTGWGSARPLTNPADHAANRRLELEYDSAQMAKAQ